MTETEADPVAWKLDDALVVTSGAELLAKLDECGTGRDKIEWAVSKFDRDEETGDVVDVPARTVARWFFRPEKYDCPFVVSDVTKRKVKDICEKGQWEPRAVEDTLTLQSKLGKIKRAVPAKADKPKDEPKKPAAK